MRHIFISLSISLALYANNSVITLSEAYQRALSYEAKLRSVAYQVDAKKEGLTKAQADAKAKAFKAEQDVNAKRLAAAAQAEADAIAAATPAVEEVAEVEAEEAPAAEENNEETQA